MGPGAHRVGGDRGQVGVLGPRLSAVDLLQRQDVGVQGLDRGGEPVEVDPAVGGDGRAGC